MKGYDNAWIELDEYGEVSLAGGYSHQQGEATMDVYYGRTRVFGLPSPLITNWEFEDLVVQYREELQAIYDGLEVKWEGSNNVGILSDDAQNIESELQMEFERFEPSHSYYDAAEWLQNHREVARDHKITAKTTDEELVEIAKQVEDEAYNVECYILTGTEGMLECIREELQAEEESW